MCKKLSISFLIFAFMFFIGCGQSEEEKVQSEAEKIKENMSEMEKEAQNWQKSFEQMGEALSEGKKVETVDFRELRNLLPESLSGMKRTNATGEKTTSFGLSISHARGDYSDEEGTKSIDIDITDMGNMAGFAGMAMYAWAFGEFDRETDSGYEKTTTFKGSRAFEKFDTVNNSGTLSVIVGKRFIVQIEGYNVSMAEIKDAAGSVDISRLDSWKDYGIEK